MQKHPSHALMSALVPSHAQSEGALKPLFFHALRWWGSRGWGWYKWQLLLVLMQLEQLGQSEEGGHSNPTCCNQICLNFLYSQVPGMLKHFACTRMSTHAFILKGSRDTNILACLCNVLLEGWWGGQSVVGVLYMTVQFHQLDWVLAGASKHKGASRHKQVQVGTHCHI